MIIEGTKIAQRIESVVADAVQQMSIPPRLVAILVADPKSDTTQSRKFLEIKQKATERVGIEFKLEVLDGSKDKKTLRRELRAIAKSPYVSGVIVQLPLPAHLDAQYILNGIPVHKDPDVLSQGAQGAFVAGRGKVLPASVVAFKAVVEEHSIPLIGKNCVVFGYGLLIGRPIAHWLASQGATVTVINEHTHDPQYFASQADIIVSGVGRAHIVTSAMVKPEAIVIDFGYNRNEKGVICGDVDFTDIADKASLITPVPGGMGPLVISALLQNLATLETSAKKLASKELNLHV